MTHISFRNISLALLAFCLLSLLSGCQKESPLSVDQMVDILFDIYRFDATVSQVDDYMGETTKASYYNGIFKKHGTDKAEFDESLKWYADHPEKWRLVYEKLGKKSEQYMNLVQQGELPEMKERGIAQHSIDTIDFWLSRDCMYWYKDEDIPMDFNRLRQTMDGRKYFLGAKKLQLTFRLRCNANDTVYTQASFILEYFRTKAKDTLHVSVPANDKWHRITLSTGSAKNNISHVTMVLADSVSASQLTSLEYEDVRFSYIYNKHEEHIEINDVRIINRDKIRTSDRQVRFNSKRGEKNSSQLDPHSRFKISRRID